MAKDSIPTGRLRRTARIGGLAGGTAARSYAARAADLTRSEEKRQAGRRAASGADGRAHPRRARPDEGRRDEDRPGGLVRRLGRAAAGGSPRGSRRSSPSCATRPRACGSRRCARCSSPIWTSGSRTCSPSSRRRRSPPRRSARCTARGCKDGRRVAVKIQYPGIARAVRSDLQNLGLILRVAKMMAPGMDPKAMAEEIRERLTEELDYELEAQTHRAFARTWRGHPFVVIPEVVTEPVERARARHRVRRGPRLRAGEGAAAARARPVRRDRVPLLPRLAVPHAALLRRSAPGQLPADGGRARRVPRLRDGEADLPRAGRGGAGRDAGRDRPRPRAPACRARRDGFLRPDGRADRRRGASRSTSRRPPGGTRSTASSRSTASTCAR